nr:hypothetical protein [Yersinia intermedia]
LGGSDYDQLPATTVVNTTLFTINDNEALIVGPMYSPIASSQLWVNLKADLGNNSSANVNINWVKVDDDNVQIPGTEGAMQAAFWIADGDESEMRLTKAITALNLLLRGLRRTG